MRKDFFLLTIACLFSIGIGVSFANAVEIIDPSEKSSKVKADEDPQFKTDSTEVAEQNKSYNPEETELGNFSSTTNANGDAVELQESQSSEQTAPSRENYYNNDEESEDSSQSMISFNFLYYLLQKFKLSNSLGY